MAPNDGDDQFDSNMDVSIKDSPGTFVAGRDITIQGDITQNIGIPHEKHVEALEEAEKQRQIIATRDVTSTDLETDFETIWAPHMKRSVILTIITISLLLSLFFFFGFSWGLCVFSIIIWLIITALNLSIFITEPKLFLD